MLSEGLGYVKHQALPLAALVLRISPIMKPTKALALTAVRKMSTEIANLTGIVARWCSKAQSDRAQTPKSA